MSCETLVEFQQTTRHYIPGNTRRTLQNNVCGAQETKTICSLWINFMDFNQGTRKYFYTVYMDVGAYKLVCGLIELGRQE
jgi:hypothetical protein